MSRSFNLLWGALLVTMTMNAPAFADSRLFSVQTDRADVSVTGASQGGRALGVAGSSGGVTFFRIDNPAGPVPCVGDMTFVLSDGSTLSRSVDFCRENWDVTLSRTPEIGPSFGSLRITTDDPAAEIVEVFVGGRPATITGGDGASVDIPIDAIQRQQGCQRDVALGLADGRRMARQVDICAGGGVVVFPLIGQDLPPVATTPVPRNPLQTLPALQPVAPVGPALVDTMEWFVTRGVGEASLTFGIQQSGSGELAAVCEPGSGAVAVVLSRTGSRLVPGATVQVHFSAGAFSAVYAGVGTDISQLSGRSHPRIDMTTGDPFWPALIRENVLTITIGTEQVYGLSLRGSAVKAREFLSLCNPAPPPPPPPATIGEVQFFCDDGSSLSAIFDSANGSVTVFDGPGGPIQLQRVPSASGGRYVSPAAELVGLDEIITWRRAGGFVRTCSPQ